MENSNIEWCDHTFNPWQICTPVSPGCANCYASARHQRFTGEKYKSGVPRERTSESYWKQPLRWNKEAEFFQLRPRVFCASLADVFDDEAPALWLGDLLCLIHETPFLDWMLLTKRPELFDVRMDAVAQTASDHLASMLALNWKNGHAPANVWLGTSVENQSTANDRVPALLGIPANLRFLSCEPLLEEVDLLQAWKMDACAQCGRDWVPNHEQDNCPSCGGSAVFRFCGIDLCICGGESGSKARVFDLEWAMALQSQCKADKVPFFLKQLGARPVVDAYCEEDSLREWALSGKHSVLNADGSLWQESDGQPRDGSLIEVSLRDKKGGDWAEWPEDLRVRQLPEVNDAS